eukprot:XP_015573614.1 SNF2 domain-containing protein CLASSY 3 isoform X1 [Ricinus communis]
MEYTLPVAKRTRSCTAAQWRERWKKERNGKEVSSNATYSTSFSGFRQVNEGKSSSESCRKDNRDGYGCDYSEGKEVSVSASFGGYRKVEGEKIVERKKTATTACSKGNGRGNLGWDDDSNDEIDLGGSNFESDGVESLGSEDVEKRGCKKSGSMEVEESCSGRKSSSNGEKDNDDDEIVEISDSESEEILVVESEESEEDNNDSDGEYDEEATSSDCSFDFQESSSGDEEEENEGVSDYRGKGEKVELGLKRKKRSGMDLNGSDDSKFDVIDDDKYFCSVSKRTRSRYPSKSNDKRIDFGSSSCPLSVEEDDLNDFEGSGDNGGDDETSGPDQKAKSRKGKLKSKKMKGDKHVQEICGGQHTKKRIRAYDDDEVVKILGNSIFDKETVLLEVINEQVKPSLPLKYTFGTEESTPIEKSEEEKELDNLWAEMALALCANDVTEQGKSEADVCPEVELDTAALCHRGNHQFILDEEIGIKCRFCSFVDLEIKYYTAPFGKQPWGNSERRDGNGEKLDIFEELHIQDSDDDSKHGYDSCTHAQGTVWGIIPGIGRDLHEHQREGFEFLWKNIAGGIYLDKLKERTRFDGGSGCIISHAPGTGKTRLAIVFLQSYMKLYPECRPLIITPSTLLLSWEAEFKKWKFDIPFHNLNTQKFCGRENAAALRLIKSGQHSINSVRMVKLYSWKKDKSVLGISYKLFEELVREDKKRSKTQQKSEDDMRNALLQLPGLLVLDEGHTPRNDNSLVFKALSRIRTDKRIILSGTPFQNNFTELFNTLLLVRPKFADSLLYNCNESFGKKRRGRKTNGARGTWASLTGSIAKDGNDRFKAEKLEEVRAMIKPFVHVYRGNILQQRLPGLRDAMVILQPVQLQKSLLDKVQGTGNFHSEYLVSLVSLHPSSLLLLKKISNLEKFAERSVLEKHKLNPEMGAKTKFLMEIILLSEAMKERVLVFSQYLDPLKLIAMQLESRFHWIQGKEILHMHGKLDMGERQSLIKDFNDRKSEAKVMLASTKACSEGINLVGASRVVLLDVVWNPSVVRQAISRAYRLGQEKVVYIYHLIASETLEEDKYCRQAEKERLSELVFDSSDRASSPQKISPKVSDGEEDRILEEIVQRKNLRDILKKIVYQPKDVIAEDFGFLNL